MLRSVVLGLGCLLLLGALVSAYWHLTPLSLELLVVGLVLAGGVAFERWRYKPSVQGRPAPHWQPTGERFTPNPDPPAPVVRYTPSEDDVHATIRLEPRAAWVSDYYPVDVVDTDPLTVRLSTSDAGVAARLLIRLGDSALLLDGPEVSEATDSLRRRILTRYL